MKFLVPPKSVLDSCNKRIINTNYINNNFAEKILKYTKNSEKIESLLRQMIGFLNHENNKISNNQIPNIDYEEEFDYIVDAIIFNNNIDLQKLAQIIQNEYIIGTYNYSYLIWAIVNHIIEKKGRKTFNNDFYQKITDEIIKEVKLNFQSSIYYGSYVKVWREKFQTSLIRILPAKFVNKILKENHPGLTYVVLENTKNKNIILKFIKDRKYRNAIVANTNIKSKLFLELFAEIEKNPNFKDLINISYSYDKFHLVEERVLKILFSKYKKLPRNFENIIANIRYDKNIKYAYKNRHLFSKESRTAIEEICYKYLSFSQIVKLLNDKTSNKLELYYNLLERFPTKQKFALELITNHIKYLDKYKSTKQLNLKKNLLDILYETGNYDHIRGLERNYYISSSHHLYSENMANMTPEDFIKNAKIIANNNYNIFDSFLVRKMASLIDASSSLEVLEILKSNKSLPQHKQCIKMFDFAETFLKNKIKNEH